MLGSGLAEVTTPQGRTIRVSVPSGSNFKSGQTVQPTFNRCCQPTGLVLPTPSSNQLKPFKDVLQPRRVSTGKEADLLPPVYTQIDINLKPHLEQSWGGSGAKTEKGLKEALGIINTISNKVPLIPQITAMPGDKALVIGVDTITSSKYVYLANIPDGLAGYYLNGKEVVFDLIEPKQHKAFPDFDPELELTELEHTVEDIYRIQISANQLTGSASSNYSYSISVNLGGGYGLNRGESNGTTTPYLGYDTYAFRIMDFLKRSNSDKCIRLHSKRVGASIVGSITSSRTFAELTFRLGEGSEEDFVETIENTFSISYPNYNFTVSKLPKLLSNLYAYPSDWVTYDIYKDKILWDNKNIVDNSFKYSEKKTDSGRTEIPNVSIETFKREETDITPDYLKLDKLMT